MRNGQLLVLGVTHPATLNSAACLLVDGRLVAMVEEERLNRLKQSPLRPANLAIQYCLGEAGCTLDEVDAIAIGWDHNVAPWTLSRLSKPKNYYLQRALMDQLLFRRDDPRIRFVNHHLAHGLSAFYVSGFEQANLMTMDGTGGGESGLLATGAGSGVTAHRRIANTSSWGHFYTLVTQKLGFTPHMAEGKTMGLAAYGTPDPGAFDACIDWDGEIPVLDRRRRIAFFSGIRAREPHEPLTREHKDLAASAQYAFERVAARMSEFLFKRSGVRNLVLGGGCALNCSSNGKLRTLPHVEHIFIQPAAHDASTALGAALKVHADVAGCRPDFRLEHPYWGPAYSSEEIARTLKAAGYARYRRSGNVAQEAAQLLADGKVLGWFQGRMEIGPRALGGRSILADPRRPGMKDAVNAIKGRENWRPFAPSILEEDVADYVTRPYPSPFMILAFEARPEVRDRIGAAVHVDGTVRVQTVSRAHNPVYWSLLDHFKRLTGVGALLNTSFNVAGEPVVCSPRDAVRTFFSCGLDYLAIGDFLVEK